MGFEMFLKISKKVKQRDKSCSLSCRLGQEETRWKNAPGESKVFPIQYSINERIFPIMD